jgi:hypothetical protein
MLDNEMDKFLTNNIGKLKMPAKAVDAAQCFGFGDANYFHTSFSGHIDGAFVKISKDLHCDAIQAIEICIDPKKCSLGESGRNPLYTFFGVLGVVCDHEEWINRTLKAFSELKENEAYCLTSESLSLSVDPRSDCCRIFAQPRAVSVVA